MSGKLSDIRHGCYPDLVLWALGSAALKHAFVIFAGYARFISGRGPGVVRRADGLLR